MLSHFLVHVRCSVKLDCLVLQQLGPVNPGRIYIGEPGSEQESQPSSYRPLPKKASGFASTITKRSSRNELVR